MTRFDSADTPLYPIDQSFVLQVSRECRSTGNLAGRVEHVVTGRATRFGSPEELFRFIAASLDAAQSADARVGSTEKR